jgi:DNA-binding NarL/FixJ family response regulator
MTDQPEPRRLLVVEDESLVAALLSQTLTNEGFAVTTCDSAAEARSLISAVDPDGALIDINLGVGPSGMHLGHVLHQTHPHIGLVFLTKYPDPAAAGEGSWEFPAGSAFLSKEHIADTQTLVDVIDQVLGDGEGLPASPPAGPLHKLTRVQREILRLTALGLTNAAIARHRSTNERTVEQRLQSVYQALDIPITGDVNPRVEAVRQYIMAAGVPAAEERQLA